VINRWINALDASIDPGILSVSGIFGAFFGIFTVI
jgi:hypothetical protein